MRLWFGASSYRWYYFKHNEENLSFPFFLFFTLRRWKPHNSIKVVQGWKLECLKAHCGFLMLWFALEDWRNWRSKTKDLSTFKNSCSSSFFLILIPSRLQTNLLAAATTSEMDFNFLAHTSIIHRHIYNFTNVISASYTSEFHVSLLIGT